MNTFNRGFLALLAIGWVAVLGVAIWLVWDQTRFVDVSNDALALNFDIITETQAEKVLATIVAGALMLPALMLLGFEAMPTRRHAEPASMSETRRLQSRVDSLERDLQAERQRSRNLQSSEADARQREPRRGIRGWHLFPRH